jgi:hypothetical protein
VAIHEATAFTLFGTAVTSEQVGVEHDWTDMALPKAAVGPAASDARVSLPLI